MGIEQQTSPPPGTASGEERDTAHGNAPLGGERSRPLDHPSERTVAGEEITPPPGPGPGPPDHAGWMTRATDRILDVAVRAGERVGALLRYPPENRFLPRLLIAAGIVLLSVVTNRSFLGWGLFVTLAVLFVPIGRARSFIVSFVPYAGVWFIFSTLRSLADETILARTLNTNVARLERWFFGGQLPTIFLQDRFFDPGNLHWQDYFLTGIHWSYFIIPHAVAVRLWQKHPDVFRQYLSGMTLLLAVGLGIYFVIPTNPPWLAPDPVNSPAAAQVTRVMEPVGEALGGGLYSASYKVIGESNPIAAMPSIHMAITFFLVFAGAAFGPRWHLAAWVYAALMGLALVYLGEHYIVDIVVGVAVASYGWYIAGYWLARMAPAVQRQLARPTAAPRGATPGARA